MNFDTLICLWILVIPIGIIGVLTSRKICFWIYFSSLHDYWSPITWNSLVYTTWGEMERCKKRALKLLKKRKKKISWNIKSKCVTDFLLTVRSSSMKDYTFHYVVITWKKIVYMKVNTNNEKSEIFFKLNGYLTRRKSLPISMFVLMASGNYDLHIHYTFLQEF
jgi:hypothetical protein